MEVSERLENGQAYVFKSVDQTKQPSLPDVFFNLTITFEFPLSPPIAWWSLKKQPLSSPFSIDRLTFSYRSLADVVEQPYRELLADVDPFSGNDVGSGWREVQRTFERRVITLRFDARDWQVKGGRLPHRIAASYSPPLWSHYRPLERMRWAAEFSTVNLPVDQWRSRYETADDLFEWLQTPPEKRDEDNRFVWWTDLRYRPSK